MDIGVVGAGICGLCTAVNFLEQGHKVTVYAEMLTPSTTSNVAPAVFFPHAVPATDLVLTAAQRTLEFYDRLPNGPTVGLRKQLHYELASERDYADTAILPFASLFPSFEELKRSLIPGGYEYGWYLTTYFIDSRQFMPYLMGRLQASGGNVVVQRFASAEEVIQLPHEVIANCSGLGSSNLFADDQPIRSEARSSTPSQWPSINRSYTTASTSSQEATVAY